MDIPSGDIKATNSRLSIKYTVPRISQNVIAAAGGDSETEPARRKFSVVDGLLQRQNMSLVLLERGFDGLISFTIPKEKLPLLVNLHAVVIALRLQDKNIEKTIKKYLNMGLLRGQEPELVMVADTV